VRVFESGLGKLFAIHTAYVQAYQHFLWIPTLNMYTPHAVDASHFLPPSHYHNEAAASTAPASLNAPEFETTISTGYFHSIHLAHPNTVSLQLVFRNRHNDVPQYAHFLPKYFPIYGTRTMVNSSSICCNDSRHSRSASERYSSSSTVELVAEEGRESISSVEGLVGGSMKESLVLSDMVAVKVGRVGGGMRG
jgi:hypothetical protein